MSSSTTPSGYKPIYTREILNHIEAELANDGEYIELQNSYGHTAKSKNVNRGIGRRDLAPGCKGQGNIVAFNDERNLRRLELRGEPSKFFPVYNLSTLFQGANRTKEETRETFAQVLQAFEASEEAAAIARLIKTNLKGCSVDKVIAFGLGRIGFLRPGPSQTFYEHAAAKIVAKAAQEVSSSPKVKLLIYDPLYTDVCKTVLEEFGLDIIQGFGAKGFSLVDDNTIVLAHHPNFPLREIIADIAKPLLISMRAQSPEGPIPFPDMRADVDSTRSREMLTGYRGVSLPISRQKAFWENTWYIRNEMADPEQVDETKGPSSK
ncbi:hypothetical protein E0Z10_g4517 [Xylaria hypoxylon]|uniref:SRR1-like domain-containing protein n=1 Tax=Xylaria hypoxylon TaxID=37992 RepID=A0A4Z0YYD8_9PEZI|nr:hypothetical protein E0Z10_g4517 [Xylaria hypoxylon]